MKSIRKKTIIRNKRFSSLVAICVAFVAVLFTVVAHPQFSHAESHYMSAVITGDNGDVDFSPGQNDAVVKFSYVKTAAHSADSKIYDAKITLNNLPVTTGQKKVSVTLPVGMIWVDDASGDQNLLSQLDASKGNNGVEVVALDQAPVLKYTFPNSGTRVYHLSEGSKAVTINIKVSADSMVNLGHIEDAIVVSLDADSEHEEASVDVNVPTGASIGGLFALPNPTNYVGAGSTFSANKDYIRSSRSNYVNGSYYSVTRLITKVKFVFHVDGKATLNLTTTSKRYTFDNSDAANGNYVITYKPDAASTGYFSIPYSITFAEDAAPGEVITVTANGETSYWQPGSPDITLEHRNTQTAKYVISPEEEDVTIGWNTLDPTKAGSAHDTSVDSPVFEGEQMTGMLGYGYVNNRGSKDSAPKMAHITFDANVLGVMMLELPCSPGGSIESVHIKTISGVDKEVTVGTSCSDYGLSGAISYADLGIEREDYITEVEYLLGVIPATTQLRNSTTNDGTRAFVFLGRRLDSSQPGIVTMEIFDADNPEKTTGIATITSNTARNIGGISLSDIDSQTKNAGDVLSFSMTISSYGTSSGPGFNYSVETPIIYLRSEAKDASGNFLPISNIKVTNGPSRGDQDITSLFGSISTFDTETARVYVLDGRNITNGAASLSTNSISEDGELSADRLNISFSIETDITTPSQSHDIAGLIFVQDPGDDSVATHDVAGDPFGINIAGSGSMVRAATTNYYQIQQSASVLTENSGKHTTSDNWLTWSEGLNPITIGSVDGSMADMKISLINNSGVAITEPVIVYSPIPKREQNWGSLSYNNQPFEFSTALSGAINNPDAEHFVIAYGKNVTPTDNGDAIEGESDKFTTDVTGWSDSDWQEVNCIKITATNIPANQPGSVDTYPFTYQLKVADLESVSDNSVNSWRPLFFQQLVNSSNDAFAGWYKGSYVSLRLANGLVSGELFVDANENGKKDTDEESLQEAGWQIDLYDRTSDKIVRSTETDTNGKYSLIELISNPDSYYVVVTNKHPIGGAGTTYLFTTKGDASNVGNYNTDNQAEGDKTSTPIHDTARITPVSPSQTPGEAQYNIGVVRYEETIPYFGIIAFDDQNNKYNTRPTTISLMAVASDGSQQPIDVNVSETGEFMVNLPKYTATADRLTYTFTSPDLANYGKTEELTSSSYSLVYTQKTATLTVHYYELGTTAQLLPDDVTTVYHGQQYETSQGTVDAEYELDSMEGENLGTVDGDIVVTYYYKKKANNTPDEPETPVQIPATIIIQFVGPDGMEIRPIERIEGHVGESYNYDAPEIAGYIFDTASENDLVFTVEERTVIYHYKLAEPEAPGTTNPTENPDPTNPVDPTNPTDPTEPTNPAVPIDPTDPNDPADPTTPTNPTGPTDTSDSTVTPEEIDAGEATDMADNSDTTETVDATDSTAALGVPNTSGLNGVKPNAGEADTSYLLTWGMCVLASTSISLLALGVKRPNKRSQK